MSLDPNEEPDLAPSTVPRRKEPRVASTHRTLAWHGASHAGRIRQGNQDRFGIDSERRLFLVADGMGGHTGGEIAAEIAVETIAREIAKRPLAGNAERDAYRVRDAINVANDEICKAARLDKKIDKMGTTVVCLLVCQDGAVVAHLGDSRVYHVRDGNLRLVTKDHSLFNELVSQGKLEERDRKDFLFSHVISKALGTGTRSAYADVAIFDLQPGDQVLLCSDGLHGPLSDDEILELLMFTPDATSAAEGLVDAANAAGGPDNVTAVVVRFE